MDKGHAHLIKEHINSAHAESLECRIEIFVQVMAALEVRHCLMLIIDIILDLQDFTTAIRCDSYPDFGVCTDNKVFELLLHSVPRHLDQSDIFTEANFVKRHHDITFGDCQMLLLFAEIRQHQFSIIEAFESACEAEAKQFGVEHAAPTESCSLVYLESLVLLG